MLSWLIICVFQTAVLPACCSEDKRCRGLLAKHEQKKIFYEAQGTAKFFNSYFVSYETLCIGIYEVLNNQCDEFFIPYVLFSIVPPHRIWFN